MGEGQRTAASPLRFAAALHRTVIEVDKAGEVGAIRA